MRILTSRAIATSAAVAIALTTVCLQPAAAGSRHGDEAAGLAAFAAVLGTVAAIIATEQYRDRPSYQPSYGYQPGYHGGPVHGPHGYWQHHR